MNVKVIQNKEEYDAAMQHLDTLMDRNPVPGSDEDNELQLLALVIEKYEESLVPPIKTDPVNAILFRMDQMGLSRKDLENYIGSPSKVSEVLARKRPLSLSMIRSLHHGLGIPADLLIADHESETGIEGLIENPDEIDYQRFPLREMIARGCFSDSLNQVKNISKEMIKSWMSEVDLPKMQTCLRAPLHQRGQRVADQYALLAWQVCVIKKAREKYDRFSVKDFDQSLITLSWLTKIAKLSACDDKQWPVLLKEHLADKGILLVIESHFKKTYLDGAAILDGKHPVVALTLRHDRLDNFWFALMHELAHVAKHLGNNYQVIMDDFDTTNDTSEIEREADDMASEALIPKEIWDTAKVRRTANIMDAVMLARDLEIHPAIVAGRLRNEKKDYRLLGGLIGKNGQVSKLMH